MKLCIYRWLLTFAKQTNCNINKYFIFVKKMFLVDAKGLCMVVSIIVYYLSLYNEAKTQKKKKLDVNIGSGTFRADAPHTTNATRL